MSNYKKQTIQQFALKALKQGFRVFLSFNGEYGFFTDNEGKKLVSFQTEYFDVVLSGNYKTSAPKQTGTGWRIGSALDFTPKQAFETIAPSWALGNATYKFTTLKQHLDFYGDSSGYIEYKLHVDYKELENVAIKAGYDVKFKIENHCFYIDKFVKGGRNIWSILFSRQDLTMGWQTADKINGSYTNHKKFKTLSGALAREL